MNVLVYSIKHLFSDSGKFGAIKEQHVQGRFFQPIKSYPVFLTPYLRSEIIVTDRSFYVDYLPLFVHSDLSTQVVQPAQPGAF